MSELTPEEKLMLEADNMRAIQELVDMGMTPEEIFEQTGLVAPAKTAAPQKELRPGGLESFGRQFVQGISSNLFDNLVNSTPEEVAQSEAALAADEKYNPGLSALGGGLGALGQGLMAYTPAGRVGRAGIGMASGAVAGYGEVPEGSDPLEYLKKMGKGALIGGLASLIPGGNAAKQALAKKAAKENSDNFIKTSLKLADETSPQITNRAYAELGEDAATKIAKLEPNKQAELTQYLSELELHETKILSSRNSIARATSKKAADGADLGKLDETIEKQTEALFKAQSDAAAARVKLQSVFEEGKTDGFRLMDLPMIAGKKTARGAKFLSERTVGNPYAAANFFEQTGVTDVPGGLMSLSRGQPQ